MRVGCRVLVLDSLKGACLDMLRAKKHFSGTPPCRGGYCGPAIEVRGSVVHLLQYGAV